MPAQQTLVVAFAIASCCASIACAEPLLLVGKSQDEASFVGTGETGTLKFQIGDQDQRVAHEQLVRWSSFQANTRKGELVLRDGSRIVLADAWSGEPGWQLTKTEVTASTQLFGTVVFPRSEVRAILAQAPQGLLARTKFLDQLLTSSETRDTVRLINGDLWQGEHVTMIESGQSTQIVQLSLTESEKPLELPMKQIAAIVMKTTETSLADKSQLVVGTRDGSLLNVISLHADENQLKLQLECDLVLSGTDRRDVNYLRSKNDRIDYLSDRDSVDFRHIPYLEIPWQYQRDRNVLGGPLQVGRRAYAKGLGVHTASRLAYGLPPNSAPRRFRRFVASVAVDDAAGQGGSVIFKVYLKHGDQWHQAFASTIVRGGDAPLPIEVELKDATQLALLADFADRGDELDYANWLDARLE